MGKFSTKWKKHVFFLYGSAPYRRLMENPKSYVCRGHFFESVRRVSGKLNVPIFSQRPKCEIVMHYKCPLADEIWKTGSVSTPGLGQWVIVRSFILIGWTVWAQERPPFSRLCRKPALTFHGYARACARVQKSLKRSRSYSFCRTPLHFFFLKFGLLTVQPPQQGAGPTKKILR